MPLRLPAIRETNYSSFYPSLLKIIEQKSSKNADKICRLRKDLTILNRRIQIKIKNGLAKRQYFRRFGFVLGHGFSQAKTRDFFLVRL